MKDKFYRRTTTGGRKVINKIERVHSSEWKYKLFYRYTNYLLKRDFQKADTYNFRNSSLNKKIPFKFWIMWWQGINKNTPKIIIKNIKNLNKILGKENIVLITKDNFEKYTNISDKILNRLNEGKINLTNFSDIVRFNLLKDNGGYWIDSTTMISPIFKEYLKKNQNNLFFTLCENKKDYHNVSYNQWTGWLIGGIPHYNLFEYACSFYNIYFERHDRIVDYFLIDDIIAHFYKTNSQFKNDCEHYKRQWQLYYWSQNFDQEYNSEMINRFENQLEYSVQKLTYKFDTQILKDKYNLAYYILNKFKE